jgi:phosphoglycerate kinase
MVALPSLLPSAMGLQLAEEVEHLSAVLHATKKPVVLIVSGAKMETKVPVIEYFLERGDHVLLGGAIANTFIAASGHAVGTSKMQEESLEKARELLLKAQGKGKARVHLPTDVRIAAEASQEARSSDASIAAVPPDMCIFDLGQHTVDAYRAIIANAGTIIWNGPLGLYEVEQFSPGSIAVAESVAAATAKGATSVLGGGDTIDLHRRYRLPLDVYTFVSMGGGAMLEFVAGKELPALKALAASKRIAKA